MVYGFCPDKPHQQVYQDYSSGKFSGDGPDQIPSWSVFKILIKACLNLAKDGEISGLTLHAYLLILILGLSLSTAVNMHTTVFSLSFKTE